MPDGFIEAEGCRVALCGVSIGECISGVPEGTKIKLRNASVP
jgi:hypothetical protein